MHFGFVFELSGTDLRNIDFLDTHLDLLDIDVPSKYFFCLHNVFKTFSRHVFKTSSRHVFKTSSRRLQRNNFLSSKTSSRRLARCLQGVFKTSSRRFCKTSSRRLGRRKIVTLKKCWRRLQDVFKINKCLLGCDYWGVIGRNPLNNSISSRAGTQTTDHYYLKSFESYHEQLLQ